MSGVVKLNLRWIINLDFLLLDVCLSLQLPPQLFTYNMVFTPKIQSRSKSTQTISGHCVHVTSLLDKKSNSGNMFTSYGLMNMSPPININQIHPLRFHIQNFQQHHVVTLLGCLKHGILVGV